MLPTGSHSQGSMQCNTCHSLVNDTGRQREMAIFFLCFSLDGDTMNREVPLKFSSAQKALSSWETQTTKSIHLIFAIMMVFLTLFLRQATRFLKLLEPMYILSHAQITH